MKVWQHYLFNYLLFIILHKYSIVQNLQEPMKATEAVVSIVLDVSKYSHGIVCREFLANVVACQHGIC